ncbi:hypothetical protein B7494_g5155 [Chlorociboria aeruginascens]|nr:hypothetical protein B7494_g5155 [Chlorociboria aeruginascens]
MATSVDAKLLKSTKFPPEFNQKVDMQKVNVEVMKKWIAGKISEILGNDDDVVIELCFNLVEGARFPDIKKMQIQLTGFLDKDTAKFCKELWKLCLSAQSNPQGVPKELLEAKKLELIQEKIDAERAAEVARQRREDEQRHERETNNIRNRERETEISIGALAEILAEEVSRDSLGHHLHVDVILEIEIRIVVRQGKPTHIFLVTAPAVGGMIEEDYPFRHHLQDVDAAKSRTARKGRDRDERRLTRSHSRSTTPPRHRRSRDRSTSLGKDRKRRHSVQRYELANKRRRNASSVSPPVDTRKKRADSEEERYRNSAGRESEVTLPGGPTEPSEMNDPQRQARELREKLLKEKIKKMRTSIDSTETHANGR